MQPLASKPRNRTQSNRLVRKFSDTGLPVFDISEIQKTGGRRVWMKQGHPLGCPCSYFLPARLSPIWYCRYGVNGPSVVI